ncbi:MAG: molybdopterin-guanine dinucleotide biosynthesis protein B [Asgard group archaeon]|nr:molybdopterin-guanine dinucleotide biosynthesis protein B [Asgard group archaeon]
MLTRFIGITGPKKSGKTTTIEALVPILQKKNLRIGTVKVAFRDVSIDVDQEHYDVIRHRQSSPKLTLFKSGIETVIFRNEKHSLREALKIISKDLDIVLLEGFKENLEGIPQITMLKEAGQEEEFIGDYTVALSSIPEFSIKSKHDLFIQYAKLADTVKEKALPLFPELDCEHCGYSTCQELMKEVIHGKKNMEDCVVLGIEDSFVILKANDKNVPCKPFIQDLIKNVVSGILTSLKVEEEELSSVEIQISYEPKKVKNNE